MGDIVDRIDELVDQLAGYGDRSGHDHIEAPRL